MKKVNFAAVLLIALLAPSIIFLNGCKKETIQKNNPVTVLSEDKDSAVFFKGYLGAEPVKFEGNALAYNGYVDPDSSNHNNQNHDNDHDYDAYYMSGSKWMQISGGGITTSNATLELRTLAVRVFVSPITSSSNNYYSMLGLPSYAITTLDNPSKGTYLAIHDKNGVLWTTAGVQDASSLLTVTSRGANMGNYTLITGTVNANMYDPQGNMKKLTGATFTAAVGL